MSKRLISSAKAGAGLEQPQHRQGGFCRCYDCMIKSGAFLEPLYGHVFDALDAAGWNAFIIQQDGDADHIVIRASRKRVS